ncbi:COG3014 family protein [Agarivorans sp. MS3-6]
MHRFFRQWGLVTQRRFACSNYRSFCRAWLAALFFSICLAGCSTAVFSDLFVSYEEQLRASRYQLGSGEFELAADLLAEGRTSDNSYYLKQLEKGRMLYLAGDYAASQQHFTKVDEQLKYLSRQAEYRLSTGLQQASALATNDNFIDYHIPVYEQVMLHHYQAINYLNSQGLESALIEVRRAAMIQQQAMQEAPLSLEEQLHDYQAQYQQLMDQYPQLNSQDKALDNAYQNGLSFALSATLYLAANQEDDAYIDFRKALALAPHNSYLQAEVARLGKKLSMSDYQEYTPLTGKPLSGEQGVLVVLHEQSIVAARREARFTLPLYNHNRWETYTVALPVISGNAQVTIPLTIDVEGQVFSTERLIQIDSLAAKQLQQDLPGILLRQILRVITKDQFRQEVNKGKSADDENWANALINVYNIMSERADTRSWQTLPALAQIAVKPLTQGSHTLHLDGLVQSELPIDIKAGRVTLMLTNDLGSPAQVFNL